MIKKIVFAIFAVALSTPAFAGAVSLEKATNIGRQYLAKSYSVNVAVVRSIENDNGGVQAVKDQQGWKIWYYPVQQGRTLSHIVLVRENGVAVELNKENAAVMSEGEGEQITRAHLLRRGISKSGTNVRVTRQGVGPVKVNELGYTEQLAPTQLRSREMKKAAQPTFSDDLPIDQTIPSDPVFDYAAYFETSVNKAGTTYGFYKVSVDATTRAVTRLERKADCVFRAITNEAKAMERLTQETDKRAKSARLNRIEVLNRCEWTVFLQTPDGNSYTVTDDGTVAASAPSYITGGLSTPAVTKPAAKKSGFSGGYLGTKAAKMPSTTRTCGACGIVAGSASCQICYT